MSNTPDIDIRPDHWEIVRAILQKHVPQYEVWAFGSRAKWTAKEFSDLDLAIMTDEPLPKEISAALAGAFEESDLPYKVDVVDWATILDDFKEKIKHARLIIKERDFTPWLDTTIESQATLQRGFDITRAEQRVGTVPVISSGGISSYHDHYKVKGPGVVLGRKGVVGSVFYCADDYWPHDTTLWVKDFHGNNERFVYYFFKSIIPIIANLDVGSANPTLNRNHLHPTKIKWPSLSEQRAIAYIIGTLDDKIELNRRMSETLESTIRAIFKDWFMDFGPVRAKAEGRQPEAMSAEVAACFPDAIATSQSGDVPLGWEYAPLSDLIQINPKERLSKGEIAPYLEMSDISTTISWPSSPRPRKFTSGMRFRNGDTLLARITPCLENGKTAFIQNLPDNTVGWGSTEFIVLRAIEPVPAEYCYLLAREESFHNYAIGSMTGSSGRQRVSAEALTNYPVVKPSGTIWANFKLLVQPLFQAVAVNSTQSHSLSQLRDTLLPKLISGELRIKNAEKFVEEALDA